MDIVDLCVPNHLHEAFALEAMQAGKHMICEKLLTGFFGGPEAPDPMGTTPKKVMLESTLRSADRDEANASRKSEPQPLITKQIA